LLAPYEVKHMKSELKDMPLKSLAVPPTSDDVLNVVTAGMDAVSKSEALELSAQRAYGAWLGYYKGNLKKCGWKAPELVQNANQWAKSVGLKEQPRLQKKTIGKMGLKGVPGLLIDTNVAPSQGRNSPAPQQQNRNNSNSNNRR
jgi:ATP-dependent RNA helicase MSS116